MPEQIELPLSPDTRIVTVSSRGTLDERFADFHAANEWIYDFLVALARDYVSRGARRIGMKHLVEVLRWQYGRATSTTGSTFFLDNSLVSRYARAITKQEPDLAGVFELRRLAVERERAA